MSSRLEGESVLVERHITEELPQVSRVAPPCRHGVAAAWQGIIQLRKGREGSSTLVLRERRGMLTYMAVTVSKSAKARMC